MDTPIPEDFKIAISDEVLTDLKDRLLRSRIADDFGNDDWRYGANGDYLVELVHYWAHDFDWRVEEKAMNAFHHQRVVLDGVPVHYIYERGRGPNPIPLIMSHGWPWTFWDFKKLIGPLTDPAAHGMDPAVSFDVVVVSLPGFGFSTPLRKTGLSAWRIADLWHTLMHDVLGYQRYAAHGGDFGAQVTSQLGHRYAEYMIGVHQTIMIPLGYWSGLDAPAPEDFSEKEALWAAKIEHFISHEAGYARIQSTKPQSLAYGMNDSPVGLLAWLVEKRRGWSDNGGNVENIFSKHDLCTIATIYWVTQSFGTAARLYYESLHNPWVADYPGYPVVRAPTGIVVYPNDVWLSPEAWARRYFNVKRWTVLPRGGHFSPAEQPELLTQEIQAFFGDLAKT